MAYHKHANRRHELPSDPNYWVELRRLSLIDAQEINRDYMGDVKVTVGSTVNQIPMRDMNGAAGVLAILRAVVARWNIDDESGAIVPITDASLKELEPDDLEFIVHTAVKGTALETTFGKASIRVAEVEADAALEEDPALEEDNLFTAGPSRP